MRRFRLVAGMGEAEMVSDPHGEYISVEDHLAVLDKIEKAAKTWKYEYEVSGHVSGFLLSVVDNARSAS